MTLGFQFANTTDKESFQKADERVLVYKDTNSISHKVKHPIIFIFTNLKQVKQQVNKLKNNCFCCFSL